MTFRHLELFLEVYKSGSITKAAENLHISQPTVTRAIKDLEGYYNIQLFDRIGKRLSVTDSGRQLYHFASQTMDSYTLMEESLQNGDSVRTVRIGASLSLGTFFLPRLITEFRKIHPEITIRSLVCNAKILETALTDNELDFALIECNISNDKMFLEAFSQDSLVLIMSPENPLTAYESITLNDIKNTSFLTREKGSITRHIIESIFVANGFHFDPIMESGSPQAIIEAVHANIGISILPINLVRDSIASGKVITKKIDNLDLVRQNYIVYRSGKFFPPSVIELLSLCRKLGKET